jgi:hypothetical protein
MPVCQTCIARRKLSNPALGMDSIFCASESAMALICSIAFLAHLKKHMSFDKEPGLCTTAAM